MRRILLVLSAAFAITWFAAPASAYEPRHDRDCRPVPIRVDHRDFRRDCAPRRFEDHREREHRDWSAHRRC
jgi:hypothetical protein